MTKLNYKSILFICLLFGLVVPACNEDDEMNPSTEELLIGKWTTTEIEASAMIGGKTVADYLVDTEGLSPALAAAQEALLIAYLERELDVMLTLNADHTYESQFAGGMDSGTWSLSADEKTLTLIEGGEEIIAVINSISETKLEATLSDEIEYDIDNDPNTPDVTIDASADLTMEK